MDQKIVDEYVEMLGVLSDGDVAFLESYSKLNPDFPHGQDAFLGRCWLSNAISHGSLETIQWFLDQGVNVNYQDDEGFSPLKWAIQRENDNRLMKKTDDASVVIGMLLRAGVDANARGTLGETPLHVAAAWGVSEKIVQLLLDWGADPNAQDFDYGHQTPIEIARQAGHDAIAVILKNALNSP